MDRNRKRPVWDELTLAVALVMLCLAGILIYQWLFLPSAQSKTVFEASRLLADEVGLQDRFHPFPEGSVTAELVAASGPEDRFARLKIARSPDYTGVTVDLGVSVPHSAALRIEWRALGGRGRHVQLDLQDGSPGVEVGWQSEIFSYFAALPSPEWGLEVVPLGSFERNSHQPDNAPADGRLDTDPIRGMNFVFPPGTKLELDVRRIDFVWGDSHPRALVLLGLFGLLGLLFLVLPPREAGPVDDLPLFQGRVCLGLLYVFSAGSLIVWVLSSHVAHSHRMDALLFGGVFALLVWDLLKAPAVWRSRAARSQYVLLVLAVAVSDAQIGAVALFLLLLGSYIPILQWRDRLLFALAAGTSALSLLVIALLGMGIAAGDSAWVALAPPLLVAFTWELSRRGTAVNRAEQAIREGEERYHSVYTLMREGMALHSMKFDEEGNAVDYVILEVNPAYEEILGVPADEVIGRLASEVYGTGMAPFLEAYAEVVRTGKPLQFESTFEPMEKVFTISAFRLSQGGFATVFEDVTAQRRLEAELRHAQKMEAVGQLAGGVAHDFNNLLQAIVGHTDLARATLEDGHPARPDLDQVQKASQRAVTLTRQLLAFSRRQEIKPEIVSLNGIIEDLAKMLRRLIGERIRLELSRCSEPLSILADRGMMEQVLMNLCLNARDAISGAGSITIETRPGSDRERSQQAFGGACATLRVSDSGCGISPEYQERIFEPFFTTKEHGTGLGLATVYGIIRQHKGTIAVESQPGVGTTFEIRLPLVAGLERVPASSDSRQASGGSETILVAEDEEGVRQMVRRLLERHGYKVYTAVDGYEAVRVVKECPDSIDMMILDMVMPGLNGLEVFRRIQRDMPQMPALFCTGYSPELLGEEGDQIPEGGLIKKPYSAAELLQRVRRILDEAASRTP